MRLPGMDQKNRFASSTSCRQQKRPFNPAMAKLLLIAALGKNREVFLDYFLVLGREALDIELGWNCRRLSCLGLLEDSLHGLRVPGNRAGSYPWS